MAATLAPAPRTAPRPTLVAALGVLRRGHAPLAWFSVGMVGLTAVALVAWSVDDRTLVGQPIWAKPVKFSISLGVYAVTLAWMVGMLPRWRRAAWWAGTAVAVASALEMVAIVGQALRGQPLLSPDGTTLLAAGGLVAVLALGGLAVAAARSRVTTAR